MKGSTRRAATRPPVLMTALPSGLLLCVPGTMQGPLAGILANNLAIRVTDVSAASQFFYAGAAVGTSLYLAWGGTTPRPGWIRSWVLGVALLIPMLAVVPAFGGRWVLFGLAFLIGLPVNALEAVLQHEMYERVDAPSRGRATARLGTAAKVLGFAALGAQGFAAEVGASRVAFVVLGGALFVCGVVLPASCVYPKGPRPPAFRASAWSQLRQAARSRRADHRRRGRHALVVSWSDRRRAFRRERLRTGEMTFADMLCVAGIRRQIVTTCAVWGAAAALATLLVPRLDEAGAAPSEITMMLFARTVALVPLWYVGDFIGRHVPERVAMISVTMAAGMVAAISLVLDDVQPSLGPLLVVTVLLIAFDTAGGAAQVAVRVGLLSQGLPSARLTLVMKCAALIVSTALGLGAARLGTPILLVAAALLVACVFALRPRRTTDPVVAEGPPASCISLDFVVVRGDYRSSPNVYLSVRALGGSLMPAGREWWRAHLLDEFTVSILLRYRHHERWVPVVVGRRAGPVADRNRRSTSGPLPRWTRRRMLLDLRRASDLRVAVRCIDMRNGTTRIDLEFKDWEALESVARRIRVWRTTEEQRLRPKVSVDAP